MNWFMSHAVSQLYTIREMEEKMEEQAPYPSPPPPHPSLAQGLALPQKTQV